MGFNVYVCCKMIVDNLAACSCSYHILAIIVMFIKNMIKHSNVKGFKTEQKAYFEKTKISNRLLHLDTAYYVAELPSAK